jgi:hypothetical protein
MVKNSISGEDILMKQSVASKFFIYSFIRIIGKGTPLWFLMGQPS